MGETQSNNNIKSNNNTNPPTTESNVSFFKSFIPQKISNDTALSFFEILRKGSHVSNNFPENLENNIKNFEHHKKQIKKDKGYIENQNNYNDMQYGNKKMSYCGCGIISVFNAINFLTNNENINLPEIINDFEKDGIILNGIFGTSPKAIEDYLIKKNYLTMSTTNENEFDEIGEKAECLILTFYNDKNNIMNQVHVINITKEKGKYYVHNCGINHQKIPYNSVSDFFKRAERGKGKGIFLIGIKRNKNNGNNINNIEISEEEKIK